MTAERKKGVLEIPLCLKTPLEQIPQIAPAGGNTAFETLLEHMTPHEEEEVPIWTPRQFEEYRKQNEPPKEFKPRHCKWHKGARHTTEDCFYSWSFDKHPVKSARLRELIKRILRKDAQIWNSSKWIERPKNLSLGTYLTKIHWPEFKKRALKLHHALVGDGEEFRGMFDKHLEKMRGMI